MFAVVVLAVVMLRPVQHCRYTAGYTTQANGQAGSQTDRRQDSAAN